MKKLLFSILLLVIGHAAFTQNSFLAQTPSGHWLVCKITGPNQVNVNASAGTYTLPGDDYYCLPSDYTGNLIIPDSVTYLGTTYSVTSIGLVEYSDYVTGFSGCAISSVTIPNTVTSITGFSQCTNLSSINIPNSVIELGTRCFAGCTNLSSIALPNSLTIIGPQCFLYCSSLNSITIPSSVTSIYLGCFEYCSNLTSVLYNATNCTIIDQTSTPYSPFRNCDNLTSVIIGEDVQTIPVCLFKNCNSLTTITIPSNVTSLGSNCFANCSSLNTVIFNAINCTFTESISDFAAFANCHNISTFTFGDQVRLIPKYLCYGLENLTEIILPNTLTSLGYWCFAGCTGLHSITIPSSVTSIEDGCFSGCSSLDSINIPNSITELSNYCFSGTNISSITIPNSVTTIRGGCFRDCTNLSSITIPNSVTNFGSGCFSGCTALTFAQIGSSIGEMSGTFLGCTHLTTIKTKAEMPPICNEYTFKDVPRYADIIVPCGAAYRYEASDYWNEFTRITEDCTNIEDIMNADDISIYAHDGRIYLQGADNIDGIVYDIEGRQVSTIHNGQSTELLHSGIYMVSIGSLPAYKVVVAR